MTPTIYRGIFGSLYVVNGRGIVCVKREGCDWMASYYSVEDFQDAIDKGYVKEVTDDTEVDY